MCTRKYYSNILQDNFLAILSYLLFLKQPLLTIVVFNRQMHIVHFDTCQLLLLIYYKRNPCLFIEQSLHCNSLQLSPHIPRLWNIYPQFSQNFQDILNSCSSTILPGIVSKLRSSSKNLGTFLSNIYNKVLCRTYDLGIVQYITTIYIYQTHSFN